MKTIADLVDNQLCTGCGTCNVLCPKSAISMHFNSIGQLLPKIDSSLCIDCGLCHDICPSLDTKKTIQRFLCNGPDLYGNILNVYIGRAQDEKIFRNSQSGGVATAILTYLFDKKLIDAAVVCHVEYSNDYQSNAIVVTSKQDLLRCQKSSYSPVDMVSALKDTASFESVAFVGTGCHIQGVHTLQSFGNGKKFANIKYLIGLICDRTLCKTATDVLYGHHDIEKKKRIIWRDKSENYKDAKLLIEYENGNRIELPSWKRHYLKNYFTAPRCQICFDKLNLGADIVLGDPWGVQGVDWKNGESLVLCRTTQGQTMIDAMMRDEYVLLRDTNSIVALKGQAIEKRLSNIRKFMLLYKENGWLLPQYSEALLSEEKVQPTTIERKTINNFYADCKRSKTAIVRKYCWKLNIMSIKNHLYRIYSFIKK